MPESNRPFDPALEAALDRLEALVESFEADPDPGVQERAVALLQSVDTVHRAGLVRLAALLGEADGPLRERALADPAVRLLFELYELLPEARPGFVPLDDIEAISAARA